MKKLAIPFIFLLIIINQELIAQRVALFSLPEFSCVGDSTFFTNQSTGNPDNLKWYFGDGEYTYSFEKPFHIYVAEGNYTVSLVAFWASPYYKDSISHSITIHPYPLIDLIYDGDTTIYEGASIQINVVGSRLEEYSWLSPQNEIVSTEDFVLANKAGHYHVFVVDEMGCKNNKQTALISIVPRPVGDVSIKVVNNILTPNGDGMNDFLLINDLSTYLKPVEIFIYNVWGDIIYSNTQYNNDWGGIGENGKELDAGTYYYMIRSEDRTGGTGYIDIIK